MFSIHVYSLLLTKPNTVSLGNQRIAGTRCVAGKGDCIVKDEQIEILCLAFSTLTKVSGTYVVSLAIE